MQVQAQRDLDPPVEWLEDGVLDWVSVDGHLLGLLWSPEGVGEEVSEVFNRLLAAQQSGVATADFSLLLTQLPQPTAWLDMELHVLEASRSFLDLFELNREDTIGQSLRQLNLPLDLQQLEDAAAGRHTDGMETEAERLDLAGQQLWLKSSVQPFFTGSQSGLLWSIRDITAEYQRGEWLSTLLGLSLIHI